ncbi:MAG: hypothetical protein M3259_09315 [Actinomycetota bacterium]|nr:hypothetical protein [Actinomycetota bacterium]
MVGRGSLRWVVVFLFRAVTILVLLITTYAYYYFQQTGATLEYGHVMVLISELDEIVPILARNVPLLTWDSLLAASST